MDCNGKGEQRQSTRLTPLDAGAVRACEQAGEGNSLRNGRRRSARRYREQARNAHDPFAGAMRHRRIPTTQSCSHEPAASDESGATTQRTIVLLKERRAALIAAALTGQLEVA